MENDLLKKKMNSESQLIKKATPDEIERYSAKLDSVKKAGILGVLLFIFSTSFLAKNYLELDKKFKHIEIQSNKLEKQLKTWRIIQGANSSKVAYGLNYIADYFSEQGNYNESEILLSKSLEMIKSELGDMHPSVQSTMFQLAQVYTNSGQYAEAETTYITILNQYKNIMGQNHTEEAVVLNALGSLYTKMGQITKAEKIYFSALDMYRNIGSRLGELKTLEGLLELYQAAGNYEKSNNIASQVIQIRKQLGINQENEKSPK